MSNFPKRLNSRLIYKLALVFLNTDDFTNFVIGKTWKVLFRYNYKSESKDEFWLIGCIFVFWRCFVLL